MYHSAETLENERIENVKLVLDFNIESDLLKVKMSLKRSKQEKLNFRKTISDWLNEKREFGNINQLVPNEWIACFKQYFKTCNFWLTEHELLFNAMPPNLKNDRELIVKFIELDFLRIKRKPVKYSRRPKYKPNMNVWSLQQASYELQNDKEIVLLAIQRRYNELVYASKELKNNKRFCLKVMQMNPFDFFRLLKQWANDKEFIMAAVNLDGLILKYASAELKNDREIVVAAFKRNGDAFEYASDELKNDREIVMMVVKRNGYALQYASERLRNDRDIVMIAIKQYRFALENASDELKNDREIILHSVNNYTPLSYIPVGWRNDREIVMIAVKNRVWCFMDASAELKNDREIAMDAITRDFFMFQFVSYELRGNREFIMEIVEKERRVLGETPIELKNDREFMLMALRKNPSAFEYAPFKWINDKEFVMRFVSQDPSNLQFLRFASEKLQNDAEMIKIANNYEVDEVEDHNDDYDEQYEDESSPRPLHEGISFFSFIFFSFAGSLLRVGFRKSGENALLKGIKQLLNRIGLFGQFHIRDDEEEGMTHQDVPKMADNLKSNRQYEIFEKHYQDLYHEREYYSEDGGLRRNYGTLLLRVVERAYRHQGLYTVGLWKVSEMICTFVSPLLLYILLESIKVGDYMKNSGALSNSNLISILPTSGQNLLGDSSPVLVSSNFTMANQTNTSWLQDNLPLSNIFFQIGLIILLFVFNMLASMSSHHFYFKNSKIWIPLIGALRVAIFQKLNRIKSEERRRFKGGELNNLFATDSDRFAKEGTKFHEMWFLVLILIVGIIIVFLFFGYSSLFGIIAMILCGPILPLISKFQSSIIGKAAEFRDERVKYMSEILNGIRVVKFYVFEEKMKEKVVEAREKEYSLLQKNMTVLSGYLFTSSLIAVIGSGVTFISYYYVGGELTLSKMFTGIVLFETCRAPLLYIPGLFSNLLMAYVSAKRIGKFLFSEDAITLPHDNQNKAMLWENNENEEIYSMDRETVIECNEASIGWSETDDPVLKDLNFKLERGKLYCVIGNTGSGKSTFISSLYGESIVKSGHVRVNPSYRISLSDETPWLINASVRDNIVFDKSLSFNQEKYDQIIDVCQLRDDLNQFPNYDETEIGFSGINLSGGQKNRISLARACFSNSEIVIMDSTLNSIDAKLCKKIFNECICGYLKDRTRILVTHSLQLLEMADEVIVFDSGRMVAKGPLRDVKDSYDFSKLISEQEEEEAKVEDVIEIIETEKKLDEKKGQLVSVEDKSNGEVSGAVIMAYLRQCGLGLSLLSLILNILSIGAKITSQAWISIMNRDLLSLQLDTYIWIFFSFGLFDSILIFCKSISLGFATLRGAMNLHGEMLNNILRAPIQFFDQNPVGRILNRFTQDLEVVDNMSLSASDLISNIFEIGFVLLLISVINPMFLIVVIPIGISFYLIQEYYRTTSREIRRLESMSKSPIMSQFNSCLEGSNTIKASLVHSNIYKSACSKIDFANKHTFGRFVANRWLGVRIHLISQSVLFFTGIFALIAQHSMDFSPAFLSLSISTSLQLSYSFQALVRAFVEVESNMTSVERIVHYAQNISQEADYEKENDPLLSEWPSKGEICLDQFSVRYRDDLDPVLLNLDLSIKAGSKVGIVGRTGSGKSTLLVSLFRFLEAFEGKIIIDGIDVSTIGLSTLRKSLLIIPQQPVLFSGSIRYNLDPFDEFEDYEIWNALERVHMKEKIQPLQLSFNVDENGSNFSIGERQLLSLSRCILRKAKIIIFDESTAYVDHNSDAIVQKVIREEFRDCTIITVAHRLDTIIDSDNIVFMKEGRIIETGSPKELLLDENSNFSKLVQETGRHYSNHLKKQAFDHSKESQ